MSVLRSTWTGAPCSVIAAHCSTPGSPLFLPNQKRILAVVTRGTYRAVSMACMHPKRLPLARKYCIYRWAQNLRPGSTSLRCGTWHVAQHRHTAIKNTRHTWASNGRRSWTYKLCISRCHFRTPYDRPRPHGGARPVPLFVSVGRRGASGGPRSRRLLATVTAAATTYNITS